MPRPAKNSFFPTTVIYFSTICQLQVWVFLCVPLNTDFLLRKKRSSVISLYSIWICTSEISNKQHCSVSLPFYGFSFLTLFSPCRYNFIMQHLRYHNLFVNSFFRLVVPPCYDVSLFIVQYSNKNRFVQNARIFRPFSSNDKIVTKFIKEHHNYIIQIKQAQVFTIFNFPLKNGVLIIQLQLAITISGIIIREFSCRWPRIFSFPFVYCICRIRRLRKCTNVPFQSSFLQQNGTEKGASNLA